MAQAFRLIVADGAAEQFLDIINFVADEFGFVYADPLETAIKAGVDSTLEMPRRHTRMRELLNRKYEYRRGLVGRHGIVFTIDDGAGVVEVVRVDLESADPRTLTDLP